MYKKLKKYPSICLTYNINIHSTSPGLDNKCSNQGIVI